MLAVNYINSKINKVCCELRAMGASLHPRLLPSRGTN